jgi:hypothetical protein
MFTSQCSQLKRTNYHNCKHLEVACQKDLTICIDPQQIEPAQWHEFDANTWFSQTLGLISLPWIHWMHRRLGDSTNPTSSATDGIIPRRSYSAEHSQCWATGMQLTGSPWDEPRKQSLLPDLQCIKSANISSLCSRQRIRRHTMAMYWSKNTVLGVWTF